MNRITQQNRLLKINTTLDEGALLLTHFEGEERLSSGYHYQLRVLVQDSNIRIDTLLEQPVSVSLCEEGRVLRYFHGRINHVSEGNRDCSHLREYQVSLVSWWWFLSLSSDCRIFQQQSVIDIFKTLCQARGFSDYDFSGLKQTYLPLEYCVQYNETSQHFLQRLLESAGIYYYFRMEKNKHTMMLVDCLSALPKSSEPVIMRNQSHHQAYLHAWQSRVSCQVSRLGIADYHFQTPNVCLLSYLNNKNHLSSMRDFEQFTYPGQISTKSEADRKLKQMLASFKWAGYTHDVEGNYLHLYAGLCFNLAEHDQTDRLGQYYIERIYHRAHDVTHLARVRSSTLVPQYYQNDFTCIRDLYPYRPKCKTKKPVMPSMQTAKVIGGFVDQYGRIKVQFHWERSGKDEQYTRCWLRVLQKVAGNQSGIQFIPRIGQEAIVQFLHGDPDRPLVTGALSNADRLSAYLLPGERHKTGFYSRFLNSCQVNEGHKFEFDDTPNQENLMIKSQKDLTQIILNDCTEQIGDGEEVTIHQDKCVEILNQHAELQAKTIKFQVGNSQILINSQDVVINSSAVKILAQGAGTLQPAARVGDQHQCPKINFDGSPHVGGSIIKGSSSVTMNHLPAARLGDKVQCHGSVNSIVQGANNILINGKPAAKLNDKLAHGGVITTGSPSVLLGEQERVSFVPSLPVTTVMPAK